MASELGAAASPSALEHELLRELVLERFGLDLPRQRRAAVAARLGTRLRARGTGTVGDYYRMLRKLDGHADEWGYFAEAVTNSETYLFRGLGQFDDLVDLLPALGRTGRPLRVLSAGCASGEEVFSLVAVLAAHANQLASGYTVTGVDISAPRLAEARAARYPLRSLRSAAVPRGVQLERHFEMDAHVWSPRAERRARVTFQLGNLADPDGLGLGRFDVIFCRNVLIYAHDDGWPRFVRTLAEALAPGGYLFLGQTETMLGHGTPFEARRLGHHFAYTLAACRSA